MKTAMVELRFLLLECFLLYSVTLLGKCSEQDLRENEERVDCVNKCNRCVDRDDCFQTAECTPGWDCKKGYFRNSQGKCVEEQFCDGDKTCGVNEEIVSCAKPEWCNTCKIRGNCKPAACTTGCDCISGFYRDSNGSCIHKFQCPRNETCGPNQEYLKCGTACPDSCENYGEPRFCTLQCVQGCFCKKGFVRTEDGRCVIPEMCGKRHCGKDEIFYNCTPSCKNTCKNYNNPGIRCACGPPGCFCAEGLVKDDDGNCVKPEMCPQSQPVSCGKNAFYGDCASLCPPTCNESDVFCPAVCVEGCICNKTGLVFDDNGDCIPKSQCPRNNGDPSTEMCGPDEQYYDCIPSCLGTCETYNKPILCSMICKSGCYCKEGLVKRKDGKCVQPKDCTEITKCGLNEEFSTCVNPCNDCEIRGKCNFLVCNKGCDCKKGHYRNKYGLCIPGVLCPRKLSCGKNAFYGDCASLCPPTCNESDVFCPAVCVEGCICNKTGLVFDDNGDCIPKSQCPRNNSEPIKCAVNEEYYDCMPLCKGDCETYNQEIACKMPCRAGCFCKQGFVKSKNGKCVSPEDCSNSE